MKKSPLAAVAAACIVAIGLLFVGGVFAASLTDKDGADRDFIEYWAAERQFIHGASPYDSNAMDRIETAAGMTRDQPLISFSPPVALLFGLPLGLLSAKTGLIVWMTALFASLAASLWLVWRMHGCPDTLLYLFAFLFAPAVMCLKAGQIGIFLLLAIVLFLRLHKSQPFLAGAALLPCALKPHLFLPVVVALVLWEVRQKSMRIVAGFAATLAASCGLTYLFDRNVWQGYSQLMHSGIMDQFVPTLGSALRFLIDRNAGWVQFVPEIICCIWAAWYFWTRRRVWDWMDHGLLLILLSIACAPYAFFTDESIALPAVLTGMMQAMNRRRSLTPIALIALAALIEVFKGVQIISPFYLWTTPAWIAWYLYATWEKRTPEPETASGAAVLAD
jgi:hypothetical protein